MGEARRRKRTGTATGSQSDMVRRFAYQIFPSGVSLTVGLGPVVCEQAEHDGRNWYFVIASGVPGDADFHVGSLKHENDDRAAAEKSRGLMMALLLERQPPSVVHDFDDELRLAQFCETAFPGEKSRSIRANVEREREHAL
jgi:hypothetical protein